MVHYPADDDNECPQCGGEGFVFQCFDGFCEDADVGCDDCTRPCPECGIRYKPAPEGLGDILAKALKK